MGASTSMELPNSNLENLIQYTCQMDELDAKYGGLSKTKTKKNHSAKKEKKVLSYKELLASLKPESEKAELSLEKRKVIRLEPKMLNKKYDGTIQADCFKNQFVRVKDVAHKILFSQESVSDFSVDKTTKEELGLDVLADKLFQQFKEEGALDIVNNNDGTFTSLDNRRLLVAKRIAGIDSTYGIFVRVHGSNDSLNKGLQIRFAATTWGEAAAVRVGKNKKGYEKEPTILKEGKALKNQKIVLEIDRNEFDYSALNEEEFKALKVVNRRVEI